MLTRTIALLLGATAMPLLGFVLLTALGNRVRTAAGYIASLLMVASLALSVVALVGWLGKSDYRGHDQEALSFRWIPLGDPATGAPAGSGASASIDRVMIAKAIQDRSDVAIGVLVDSLTITLFVVICLVAVLGHFFSIAYLAGDPHYRRFFSWLNLFTFAVLALVLANGLVQMLVFWELAGVSAYLLTGFWSEKKAVVRAAKRAAIFGSIGAACWMLALGLLVMRIGFAGLTLVNATPLNALQLSLASAVRSSVGGATMDILQFGGPDWLGFGWLTWVGVLLFLAVASRLAIFPLHVWLADAMEAPDSVTAMVHGSVMIVAGLYVLARLFPILTLDARHFMAIMACFTIGIAALLAMVQTDLKKLLAYAMMYQTGLMVLILACGGYVAGLFHALTHAFFNASLMLSAAAVILACGRQKDIRKMGGLWKKMPITAGAFLVGVLAASGTPWLSGYFSRELGISIVRAYAFALPPDESQWFWWTPRLLYWVPVAGAFLTSFYLWRAWWLVFGGQPRDEDVYEKASESPAMTLPLLLLTGLVVISGFVFIDRLIANSVVPDVMVVVDGDSPRDLREVLSHFAGWTFAVGPFLAVLIYMRGMGVADRMRRWPLLNLIYIWLKDSLFLDYLYDGFFGGIIRISGWLIARLDRAVLDGVLRFAAYAAGLFARLFMELERWVLDMPVDLLSRGLAFFITPAVRRGSDTGSSTDSL